MKLIEIFKNDVTAERCSLCIRVKGLITAGKEIHIWKIGR